MLPQPTVAKLANNGLKLGNCRNWYIMTTDLMCSVLCSLYPKGMVPFVALDIPSCCISLFTVPEVLVMRAPYQSIQGKTITQASRVYPLDLASCREQWLLLLFAQQLYMYPCQCLYCSVCMTLTWLVGYVRVCHYLCERVSVYWAEWDGMSLTHG